MARSSKLGTFGGVFTPAILTILGVIMYMRLPWIIGNAGFWYAVGIVVVAHVVSITTGLSVSSMATDKRVKAGGSYYILSRSLGLPIGGTLGIALFVGLSFSIALYIIGFSESFLSYFEYDVNIANIRTTGTIVLFCVTTITFISTALAIKMQFFIMAAIAISLVSIFVGNPDVPKPDTVQMAAAGGGASMALIFGIFFPAVTGFEAGVSMSGDLKDARKSIPFGTMAAILVGLFSYIGLAYFFAWRIPTDQLMNNPRVLLDYAYMEELVLPGVWGATISSALGSLLGAPRILQAAAADGIGPRFFEHGHGKDNEPRRAVVLTFFVAWIGILVGDLDVIARVVSMFFLTSYGFLNLSAFIESWVSPDFRPAFRVPRFVSLIGAITCLVLMINMDVLAMAAASLAMAGLYLLLKRRELVVEGGDTWGGVWTSIVSEGLERLSASNAHERNWRPNAIAFGKDPMSTIKTLVGKSGRASDLTGLSGPDVQATWESRLEATKYHGLPGLQPNTVVLGLAEASNNPNESRAFYQALDNDRFNFLLTSGHGVPSPGRVDVWWRGEGRNLALQMALVRSLTSAKAWRRAEINFYLPVQDLADRRAIEQRISRWLSQARVKAQLRTVPSADPQTISNVSADASLVLLGMPHHETLEGDWGDTLRTLAEPLQHIAFVRAATTFSNPIEDLSGTVIQVSGAELEHELVEDEELADALGQIQLDLIMALTSFDKELVDATSTELEDAAAQFHKAASKTSRQIARLNEGDAAILERLRPTISNTLWATLAESSGSLGHSEEEYHQRLLDAVGSFDAALNDMVGVAPHQLNISYEDGPEHVKWGQPQSAIKRLKFGRKFYLQAELAEILATELPQVVEVAVGKLLAGRVRNVIGLHAVCMSVAGAIDQDEAAVDRALEQWRQGAEAAKTAQRKHLMAAGKAVVDGLVVALKSTGRRVLAPRPAGDTTWIATDELEEAADHLATIDLALQTTELEIELMRMKQRMSTAVSEAESRLDARLDAGLRAELKNLGRRLEDGADGDGVRRRGDFDLEQLYKDIASAVDAAVNHLPEVVRIVPDELLTQFETGEDPEEVAIEKISVRQLLNYRLESDFLVNVRDAGKELERVARRAEDATRDVARVLRDLDPDPDTMSSSEADELVSEAKARVQKVADDLNAQHTLFVDTLHQTLGKTLDAVTAQTVTEQARELPHFLLSEGQKRLISRATDIAASARAGVNRKLVDLSLQLDAGFTAAATEEHQPHGIEGLLALYAQTAPTPSALQELPAFYRRAFLSRATASELLVGGERELNEARRALELYSSGHRGAILVSGPVQSGKSTFLERMEDVLKDRKVVQIAPPKVATADVGRFAEALAVACGTAKDTHIDASIRSLRHGTVVMVPDAEMWWLRSNEGTTVLEALENLIDGFSHRLLFVVSCGEASLNLLDRLGLLSGSAITHIRIPALDSSDLLQAILKRHQPTGMDLELDGKPAAPGDVSLARFLVQLRAWSEGHVGVALHAWISHVESSANSNVSLASPVPISLNCLSHIPREWLPVLAALALHRRLDDAGLVTATHQHNAVHIAKILTRSGVTKRHGDITELDRFVAPHLLRWLQEKGVLA